jgi:hypothetical protein
MITCINRMNLVLVPSRILILSSANTMSMSPDMEVSGHDLFELELRHPFLNYFLDIEILGQYLPFECCH